MAQVPYTGVASVDPDTRAPDDYQNIHASADQFGGLLAKGEEKAGQGIENASGNLFNIAQFYGKINADYEGNNFIDARNRILYGDPKNMITGPDGTQVPDTGFMGLSGRAAADQREGTLKALEQARQAGRGNLKSPAEQLEYDNQTRRIYAEAEAHIGAHSETQWKTWAGGVNDGGATHALSQIARDPDNGQNVAHAASDLINFRVQQAQLKYGDSPEITRTAIETAKRDALKAQITSIGAKDPARALSILDKNKPIAGNEYDQLYEHFRARAESANGTNAANEAIHQVGRDRATMGPVAPVALKGAIMGQESDYGRNAATSVTGAVGPMQIQPATFKQYAQPGEEISSAADNIRVGGRIIDDYMKRYNGDPERVAVAYFSGPGNVAPAGSPSPYLRNVSDPNGKSVSSYVNDVSARLGGSTTMKADAYKLVMNNPDLNDNERQHAFTRINQVQAASQVAADATSKQEKELNDTAANKYTSQMIAGNARADIIDQIAADPNLKWETKQHLYAFASQKMGIEDPIQYGPGYVDAYKRIFAPSDDPNKITDINQILQMGLPGGGLTTRGVDRMSRLYVESHKQPDASSINQTKIALINYAKGKLSFEQDVGPIKIRDPKGENLFNGKFIPSFEAAFDKWMQQSKNPWEFLTQENIDKILQPFARPKAEMNRDRVDATGESIPGQAEEKQAMPPPPEGVVASGWTDVMKRPPPRQNGTPWRYEDWAKAVNILRADPNPDSAAYQWFNHRFQSAGVTADWVLDRIDPKRRNAEDVIPPGLAGLAHAAQPVAEASAATGLGQ